MDRHHRRALFLVPHPHGKPGDKGADALADELADVVWVVAAIANQTGVDLAEAFRVNLDKKTRRDATRHRDNPKLHNQ